MTERWDKYFLDLALVNAAMSKDPSTQVGAVIVGEDNETLCGGFNGLPRSIADTSERLNDRETKLKYVVHAEMNAVLVAARRGIAIKGCTMYVVARDTKSGRIWGGCPCIRCTVELIQTGIKQIVSYDSSGVPERWRGNLVEAETLLVEAGIGYREVPL